MRMTARVYCSFSAVLLFLSACLSATDAGVVGRPKTQCEQHRGRLQSANGGVPLMGSYIPECDEEGRYRPQQCHGSTGYCWCVDSRGQERAGTRTPPGTPARNCDEPGRPKTQCEQHRDRLQSANGGVPLMGSYIPECDEEGRYRPQQCHGSTGYCWCVDSRGQERPGTRTPPGTPARNCDEPGRPKTQCEQHRDRLQSANGGVPLIGSYIPECDEQGQYRPQQCHGSTGYCWCVDSRGQERAGTRTPPGTPTINCDEPANPKPPLKPADEQPKPLLKPADEQPKPLLKPADEQPKPLLKPADEQPKPLLKPADEQPKPLLKPADEQPKPLLKPADEHPKPPLPASSPRLQ